MRNLTLSLALAALLLTTFHAAAQSETQPDPADWPTYNHDPAGYRFNPAETTLSPTTVPNLVEKWRFPAANSNQQIGVIHATPTVVNGYVYFGTATNGAFYKLTPSGKLKWVYRNPLYPKLDPDDVSQARFQTQEAGVFSSALVTHNAVYFGDMTGWFYSLDRATGKERWKINTRAASFPNAHPINVFMGSPILADGKIIVPGGTLEQVASGYIPGYPANTGRGYVMALDPDSGKIIWKFNVGPEPQPLNPPITITDTFGTHTFSFGPATSSVWSTPSFDPDTQTIFFGTDVNTAPRQPTPDNSNLHTPESCAVIALNVNTGQPRWIRQITPGDVWINTMRAYDPKTRLYKDQSIGDTPKIYTINHNNTPTKVVGVGSKNGGFYVINAATGDIIVNTPIYTGPPTRNPKSNPRTLALPSPIGGLQTGSATDGTNVYTNGIDAIGLGTMPSIAASILPTGGRVTSISADTSTEHWRHNRPVIKDIGGPAPAPVYHNIGDPVASGVALANGVVYFTTAASGNLIALNAKDGSLLKQIPLGPVWSGPSVSRGRVYIGTGNTLFSPDPSEAFFPKKFTGTLHSFGLPTTDQTDRLNDGNE